jgi:hypothetical protein
MMLPRKTMFSGSRSRKRRNQSGQGCNYDYTVESPGGGFTVDLYDTLIPHNLPVAPLQNYSKRNSRYDRRQGDYGMSVAMATAMATARPQAMIAL